jgi:trans-aconitate methyltransferase
MDRGEFIVQHCRAAGDVAHIGCTDSPYTEYRLVTGTLLHERLLGTGTVVGFDIDEAALDQLRSRFPTASFVCADVSAHVPSDYLGGFQIVVAGEVLEHVPNAEAFLAGARQLLAADGRLLVSVPNACSPKIGARSLTGRESVHPDHRVYYGPRTLRHTLETAGYRVDFMATYLASPGPVGRQLNVVLRLVNRVNGGPVGDGLIALARAC